MQPIVVLYLLWVLWFLTWLAVAIAGDPGPRKVKGPLLFGFRLTVLAATLLLFTITPWPGLDVQYRFWDRALSEDTGWLLIAAVFAGFTLAWWATVARLIAGRRRDSVVECGPYRFVRHPTYLGLIIAAVATAGMFGRPSSSAGAAIFIMAFLVRILVEERALRDDEPVYDDYAERVPMLLPIPKWHSHPHSSGSMRRIPEPTPFLLPSEPVGAPAEHETATLSSETPSEPLPKPVQLKLSLDLENGEGPSALTGADSKM